MSGPFAWVGAQTREGVQRPGVTVPEALRLILGDPDAAVVELPCVKGDLVYLVHLDDRYGTFRYPSREVLYLAWNIDDGTHRLGHLETLYASMVWGEKGQGMLGLASSLMGVVAEMGWSSTGDTADQQFYRKWYSVAARVVQHWIDTEKSSGHPIGAIRLMLVLELEGMDKAEVAPMLATLAG